MSYYICGLDEVGRGAFAGPMLAVAAMFETDSKDEGTWVKKMTPILGVDDSKAFSSHEKRLVVYQRLLYSTKMVDFSVGHVDVEEIDKVGIDEANRIAFYRAWSGLKHEPSFILADGDKPVPAWNYSQQRNRPKGDSFWWPVGAASILAKVIRDTLMTEFDKDYPSYRFASNSGYGTADHIAALKKSGPCPLHRKQFISKYVRG